MSLETVDEIAEKISHSAKSVRWIWHGGEALLMGQEWLYQAHRIIKKHIKDLKLSVQTNGVLLSEDMALFLKSEDVSVGVSYDGITHENTRRNGDAVLQNLLSAREVIRVAPITVIGEHNIDKASATYDDYKEKGMYQFSFNLVHKKFMGDSSVFDNVEEFCEKYAKFFDKWFYDTDNVDERTFFSFVKLIMGSEQVPCGMSGCIGKWIGVNPVGDIYPCDRYYPEKYHLGNIKDYLSLIEVFDNPNYIQLKMEVAERRINCLENCEIAEFCFGGCNGTAILSHGDASKPDEDVCYINKYMITHVFNRIKDLSYEDMKNINPVVSEFLKKEGYRSLTHIREMITNGYIEK